MNILDLMIILPLAGVFAILVGVPSRAAALVTAVSTPLLWSDWFPCSTNPSARR